MFLALASKTANVRLKKGPFRKQPNAERTFMELPYII